MSRSTPGELAAKRRRPQQNWNLWTMVLTGVALVVALPVIVVFTHIALPTDGVWQHLASTVLTRYLNNTFGLFWWWVSEP